MPKGKQQTVTLETNSFGGINTARQFSQIPREQSPSMINGVQKKLGSLSKRDGTIPVTAALGNSIDFLTAYRTTTDMLLATSGTTLYKWDGAIALTAQTMTNPLVKGDIYTVSFTDAANNSILFIVDGGNMKQYDGTTVKDIPAAANDASPNPANDMATVNTKKPIYCWVYSSHVFVSDGKDICWYSKRFKYNYFPQVQSERWVRNDDYITGCGISMNNVCLIPMRRGWGFLTGATVDNFSGNQFINTINGCIAPRSIQKITYPNGQQTIAYLSDDGIYEVYDTGAIDAGSRQYATRSLMIEKVDFAALGLTEAEKKAAVAYYDQTSNLYILCFKRGTDNFAYAYDTRNSEWYPWDNIKANSMIRFNGVLYYAGSDMQLRKFDEKLYSDWNDTAKTSGTPVKFKRYSPAVSFEFSGYQSYWDYYLLESKQWNVPATLDIAVVFSESMVELANAIQNEAFTWGASQWGKAKWSNANYTDTVNEPNELAFHKKAKYAQVLWKNERDEPVTLYKERWKGRISGR